LIQSPENFPQKRLIGRWKRAIKDTCFIVAFYELALAIRFVLAAGLGIRTRDGTGHSLPAMTQFSHP